MQSILMRRTPLVKRQRSIKCLSSKSNMKQSFFAHVNEQMKRESPYKYEQYEKGRDEALRKLRKRLDEERAKNAGKWWVNPPRTAAAAANNESSSNCFRIDEFMSKSLNKHINATSRSSFKLGGIEPDSLPKSSIFSTISANMKSLENDGDISSMFAPKPPPPKIERNKAMLFDPDYYETYQELMTFVMDEDKSKKYVKKVIKEGYPKELVEAVQKWLLSDERVIEKQIVEERWKRLDDVWRNGWKEGASTIFEAATDEETNEHESMLLIELKSQQDLFIEKIIADNPTMLEAFAADIPDDNEQHIQTKVGIAEQFEELSIRIITFLLRHCAKRSRSDAMHVCWYKVKESGLKLPQDSISTLLYIVTTMGSSFGSSTFRSHEKDEEQINTYLVPEEVATYHDLICQPTESSVSLRIKTLAGKGDTETAEELLEAYKKSIQERGSEEWIKLRTYIPVFKNYCDSGNVAKALSVFHKMKNTESVMLEPENYCMLLATLAENGCFRIDAYAIDGAQSLGYKHPCGPELFDEIANDMADNVLEISSASARRLSNALAAGFRDAPEPAIESENYDGVVSNVKDAHPLAPMPLTTRRAAANELVACRVLLDRSAGVCKVTGSQQRLILLCSDQRKQLQGDLIDLASTQYTNWTKNIDTKRDKHAAMDSENKASEQLQKFSEWLDVREGEPFTAIVDGANVGYYMQNFDKGGFNYHQIKFMVDSLETRGEKPLVVLPNKYSHTNYIYNSKQQYQYLNESDVEIMKSLKDRDMLYSVPPRCLDDLYWMVASVSDQTASRKGKDLSVPSHDPTGRFPGTRPMLITNDQMRDHRLELLEPRLFRRWYGCHIVNYSFTAFVMDESVAGNEVRFAQADFFSREIQGNECPASYDGKWKGLSWHFPITDWDLDERFVVRIPTLQT
ncbi:hypothetical protein ACHAXN_008437 [Cyclotella atomus]